MKKYILLICIIVRIQFSFGQNFMNYEKLLIVDLLFDIGFDTISGSKKLIIDSSDVLIAKFNENYCTYIEYHLKNDGETDICDSIFCTSSCNECFDVTLNEFLLSNNKKWKKKLNNEYYSLMNKGKSTIFGPPKVIEYQIEKLEVVKSIENKTPNFKIYRVWISKNEFKKLKKLKTYS